MSNITTFNPSANLPSYATKGALSSIALAIAGSGSTGKRISIKGGVFRLFSGGKEVTAIDERYLDVVIVNAAPKVSRVFYGVKFVEGQSTPPTCWSADGDKPDAATASPCAPTCASCPNNVKGSGEGDSRACQFNQRLAVVLANDTEGDVLALTLPAQSIFGKGEGDSRPLQEYARFYAAQGHDIAKFITRMRFDTSAAVPKLFFKGMRWLTDDEYATCLEQSATPEAIKAITMTVSQQDGVAAAAPAPLALPGKAPAAPAAKAKPAPMEDDEPPPPPAKKVAAPAAKAKPAPMEDDEPPPPPAKKARPAPKEYAADGGEAEPEPEVKRAAKAPVVASSGGLNDVLSTWDDE